MSVQDIIRAWKDAQYRQSLSEAELTLVPEHPAGAIELHARELELVNGGADQAALFGGCGDETVQQTCYTTGVLPQIADQKRRFLSDSIILCCC